MSEFLQRRGTEPEELTGLSHVLTDTFCLALCQLVQSLLLLVLRLIEIKTRRIKIRISTSKNTNWLKEIIPIK